MRYLIAVLALLASSVVSAASVELSWTPPTTYTNGDPLNPAADLEGYGVYVNGERAGTAAPGTRSYVVDDLDYASYSFAVTAIAKNGIESDMSNIVTRQIEDDRKPSPPTLLDALVAFVKRVLAWFA